MDDLDISYEDQIRYLTYLALPPAYAMCKMEAKQEGIYTKLLRSKPSFKKDLEILAIAMLAISNSLSRARE